MTDPIHDAPEWARYVTLWGLMPEFKHFPDKAAAEAFKRRLVREGEHDPEVREVGA